MVWDTHLIGSLFGHVPNLLETFMEPVFEHSAHIVATAVPVEHVSEGAEWKLMSTSVVVAIIGICLAYFIYMIHGKELPQKLAKEYAWHYQVIYNKYYIDEIYEVMVIWPIYHFSVFLWKVVDAFMIDGIGVNGPGWLVKRTSASARLIQNGYVQTCGGFMLMGLVAIICFYIYR